MGHFNNFPTCDTFHTHSSTITICSFPKRSWDSSTKIKKKTFLRYMIITFMVSIAVALTISFFITIFQNNSFNNPHCDQQEISKVQEKFHWLLESSYSSWPWNVIPCLKRNQTQSIDAFKWIQYSLRTWFDC